MSEEIQFGDPSYDGPFPVGPIPTKVVREEIVKPRFDVKVALTTRGWSWEIEVKDCMDEATAELLMQAASKVVTKKMEEVGNEQDN